MTVVPQGELAAARGSVPIKSETVTRGKRIEILWFTFTCRGIAKSGAC